ncbi:MAG: hypothetical protein M3Q65_25965 [Chloroflexota bacterium]|nr:hypothetical protein [Chloroflexota bacterium]
MSTTRAGRAGQDGVGRERLPIGIPLAEAAARLGLSIEATRKRAQRGSLSGYKFAGAWYVILPAAQDGQDATARTASTPGQDTVQPTSLDNGQDSGLDAIEARFRVTPAEIERAVSRTSAQYIGDLRTVLAEVGKVYEGRIAATEAASAAKDETIAELRRRAEAAEAERLAVERERDELRRRLDAAQAAPQAPGAAEDPAPAAVARVLQRLRASGGG